MPSRKHNWSPWATLECGCIRRSGGKARGWGGKLGHDCKKQKQMHSSPDWQPTRWVKFWSNSAKELKGNEIDKKQIEHNHIKAEEAWLSFVCQVLHTNKAQMTKLHEDFLFDGLCCWESRCPHTSLTRNMWWQLHPRQQESQSKWCGSRCNSSYYRNTFNFI